MTQGNAATRFAIENFDRLPDSAHVQVLVVCTLLACSPATVWRRVRNGEIVPPVRLGKRTTRWRVGELRASLNLRKSP